MEADYEKNGGPNHLRAWREHRKLSQGDVAKALDITVGQVSELENSKRGLSAKWLRRLAPVLKTTPGHLLDHNPRDMDSDILEIWMTADPEERKRLVDVAKALVRTSATA